jgi:hypothetical protein
MAYALDREVDDGIVDRFGPHAIGRDVTGVVRVHLVREGQDDASGEFVVIILRSSPTISKPNS